MVKKWTAEISTRIHRERQTNIIRTIAQRENRHYNTIYYWFMSEHYREQRRQHAKEYRQQHMVEYRDRSRKYAQQHREDQVKYQQIRYTQSAIKKKICFRMQLYRKINRHIDQLLPELIENHQPVTARDMADSLENMITVTVRPATLDRAVKDYLAHYSNPIIKELKSGKYIKS